MDSDLNILDDLILKTPDFQKKNAQIWMCCDRYERLGLTYYKGFKIMTSKLMPKDYIIISNLFAK